MVSAHGDREILDFILVQRKFNKCKCIHFLRVEKLRTLIGQICRHCGEAESEITKVSELKYEEDYKNKNIKIKDG